MYSYNHSSPTHTHITYNTSLQARYITKSSFFRNPVKHTTTPYIARLYKGRVLFGNFSFRSASCCNATAPSILCGGLCSSLKLQLSKSSRTNTVVHVTSATCSRPVSDVITGTPKSCAARHVTESSTTLPTRHIRLSNGNGTAKKYQIVLF